ncbi:hypothetical protein GCM10009087_31870 [Sphingomonas oligophenolica]|uniref:Uncharacterized protein n=1 Tax=Sphingomonas oligophenolica TaxID=301154 RepID=A0ABU9XY62_9SPHN
MTSPYEGGAGWLSLAATPSFAFMAVLTATHGPADMPGMSPLTGMVPMYVLMSVFHCTPWVAFISKRRIRRPTSF